MIELTFTVEAQDDRRTVTGEVERDGDAVIVRENHEARPNWRVEPDDTVTLVSPKSGVEVEEFGVRPHFDGYCRRHNVNVERLPDRDRCPHCRMEQDRQEEMVERATRHAPRMVDDPASIDAYRN